MTMRYGTGVMVIAAVHELVGLVLGWSVTLDIVRDGVLNALGQDWQRNALFWFHVSGIALFVIGDLMRAFERKVGELPSRFGWMLVSIGVGGIAMMPASGFWLVAAWGLFMILAPRFGVRPAAA